MSLRKDFDALPFTHRAVVMLACMSIAALCGTVAALHERSGLEIGIVGGCSGLLLYHVLARVVAYLFMRKLVTRMGRERAATAGQRAVDLARSQLARARALMAAGGMRRTDRREATSVSPAGRPKHESPPAPRPRSRMRGPARRPFGRRRSRRNR